MNDYILETKNLTKKFGKQLAVNQINLQIKRNSIYGLLGPNGAGKTTTLKMIIGLLKPSQGEIFFNQQAWQRKHLAHIGSLIESPALYGNLTAAENLKIHTTLLGLSKERIEQVLEVVDLQNTGKKTAAKFSMGMKQRLGIAIALLNNPSLLILDEPTNGLDPFGIQELRSLIASFPQKGISVILSSHILPEVAQVVDHVGIINQGELLYQGENQNHQNLENLFIEVIKGARQ